MDFEEYRVAAKRSMSPGDPADFNLRQAVWALGLTGEAGEVATVLLDPYPNLHLLDKEIGDVMWYVAAICTHNGWSLAEIAGVYSMAEYMLWSPMVAEGARNGLFLCIRASALADYIKKVVGHGHPMDEARLRLLLGAVLNTVRVTCQAHGLDLEQVCVANIAKLNARYPQGFATADSLRRDVEAK